MDADQIDLASYGNGSDRLVIPAMVVVAVLFALALFLNERHGSLGGPALASETVVRVNWQLAPSDLDFLPVERILARFVKIRDDLDPPGYREYLWQLLAAMNEAVERSALPREATARASFLVGQALPGDDGETLSAFFPYVVHCLGVRRRFLAMPWFRPSEAAQPALIKQTAGDHLQQLCLAQAPLSLPPSEEGAMMRFAMVRELVLQRHDLDEDQQAIMLAQLFETAFSGSAP